MSFSITCGVVPGIGFLGESFPRMLVGLFVVVSGHEYDISCQDMPPVQSLSKTALDYIIHHDVLEYKIQVIWE